MKGNTYRVNQRWRHTTCLQHPCYDVGCYPCISQMYRAQCAVSQMYRAQCAVSQMYRAQCAVSQMYRAQCAVSQMYRAQCAVSQMYRAQCAVSQMYRVYSLDVCSHEQAPFLQTPLHERLDEQ